MRKSAVPPAPPIEPGRVVGDGPTAASMTKCPQSNSGNEQYGHFGTQPGTLWFPTAADISKYADYAYVACSPSSPRFAD